VLDPVIDFNPKDRFTLVRLLTPLLVFLILFLFRKNKVFVTVFVFVLVLDFDFDFDFYFLFLNPPDFIMAENFFLAASCFAEAMIKLQRSCLH